MKWLLVLTVFGDVVLTQGPFMALDECERWKAAAVVQAEQRLAEGVMVPPYKGRTITRADVELECKAVRNRPVRL